MTLGEVVGQPQVTEPLMKSLGQGKISHAYLFIGPRGCGKTSVARILAHEVNGFKYEVEDDYVDIIEIDGASNRGIDNIRELREKVAIAPTTGKYKVYIIDEVHMLTKEAFNALLKTLEEPPAHAIFIMATTDAYKVPVTITSRAQTYTFKLADTDLALKFLKDVCKKEKIKITDDALRIIAKKGGGSFRDSLSLLDQISTLSEDEITKEMVIAAMGLPQEEKVAELLSAYASCNVVNITTVLKNLLASGVKAETLTEEMIGTIVERPKPELLPLLAKLPDVKAPYAEAKLLVALTRVAENAFFKEPPRFGRSEAYIPDATEKAARRADFHGSLAYDAEGGQVAPEKGVSDRPCASVTKVFDWGQFTNKVQSLNDAVYSQLQKTVHEFTDGVLHIYPKRRIVKTILSRDNNKRILTDAVGSDVKITIHDETETPSEAKKDETLSKMSVIMGGEVENDGGGSPF